MENSNRSDKSVGFDYNGKRHEERSDNNLEKELFDFNGSPNSTTLKKMKVKIVINQEIMRKLI